MQTTNYLAEYDKLIKFYQDNPPDKAKEYCERHHIVMRALGGTNDKSNIVLLPVIQHIKAHVFLALGYENVDIFKHAKALNALTKIVNGKSVQVQRISSADLTDEQIAIIAEARKQAAQAKKNQFLIYEIATGKKKRWPNGQPIPDGWAKGAPCTKAELEHRHQVYSRRKWITDGKQDRFVDIDQIQDYLDKGWKYGRVVFPDGWHAAKKKWCREHPPSNRGHRWIHTIDGQAKCILKTDPLPNGWLEGRGTVPRRNLEKFQKYQAFGQSKTIQEWSDEFHISVKNIRSRLSKGWTLERALTQAKRKR